jgi:hypothetical protein
MSTPYANTATGAPPAPAASGTALFSKAKDLWAKFSQGKMPIVILLVGVVLLFIIVILFIIFSIKSSKLSGKQLTTKPIKLDELTTPFEVSSSELPKPVVGREYSFSFWLYIDQFAQTFDRDGTGKLIPKDKMIFYRGSQGDISTANPVVFMDGLSNKLHIAIKTQESTLTSIPNQIDYNKNLYNIKFMNYFMNPKLKIRDTSDPLHAAINKYIVLSIDYVPLQRWVNVSFIVDNKICTVFMDGEIYSVKSTEEFKAIREKELDLRGRPIDVNIIVDKTDGNLYIGKNNVGNQITVPGYLNKLQFFNYAMSVSEVKTLYEAGPLGKKLFGGSGSGGGINISYGIRNPVYKLDENA